MHNGMISRLSQTILHTCGRWEWEGAGGTQGFSSTNRRCIQVLHYMAL